VVFPVANPTLHDGAEEGVRRVVPTIEILIADDHQMLREGLRSLLEREPGIAVVGEAANGAEAVSLSREMRPAVVIMDIEMPEINGIEATRRITAEMPEIKVIGLSMHADADVVESMKQAGATAFVAKDSAFERLVSAVRAVTTNGTCGTETSQRP
jgi:DNA-binding NarL/FixJ family response regulator